MFAGENTAYLRYDGNNDIVMDVSSANSTDTFSWKIHYTSGGVKETTDVVYGEGKTSAQISATSVAMQYTSGKTPDVNTSVQVEVTNTGTGEVFYSNSIAYKAPKA